MSVEDLKKLSDEELLKLGDNEDAKNVLYSRVLPLLRSVASHFVIRGYDGEDLLQEASIAFTNAMRTYRDDGEAQFRTYLFKCARTHLLNLAKRMKREEQTVSLFDPLNDQSPDILVIDTLISEGDEFTEQVMREALSDLISEIAERELSDFEYTVFQMFFMQGTKVAEIAQMLQCPPKSVENTLYRIRTKLKKALA